MHVIGVNDPPVAQDFELYLSHDDVIDMSSYISDPDLEDELFIQSVPPGNIENGNFRTSSIFLCLLSA